MSAAGSLPYLFGIGGFLVDFVFAVISVGLTIQCLMSSADSFPPTPSSGTALLPLPATWWHIEHFWAVKTASPFLTCAWSAAAANDAVLRVRTRATGNTSRAERVSCMEPPERVRWRWRTTPHAKRTLPVRALERWFASGAAEDLRNAVGFHGRPWAPVYSGKMRIAAAFLIFVLSVLVPAPARAQAAPATVTILHFHDAYQIPPGDAA